MEIWYVVHKYFAIVFVCFEFLFVFLFLQFGWGKHLKEEKYKCIANDILSDIDVDTEVSQTCFKALGKDRFSTDTICMLLESKCFMNNDCVINALTKCKKDKNGNDIRGTSLLDKLELRQNISDKARENISASRNNNTQVKNLVKK